MKRSISDDVFDMIRAEFVSGDDSVASLARKHQIDLITLQKEAKQANWKGLREAYRSKSNTDAMKEIALSEADIRTRHIEIARRMQDKAVARLARMNPDQMSYSEIRAFLATSCEIERKAAGIVDKLKTDAASLTDEERVDRIAEILASARARGASGSTDSVEEGELN